MHIPMIWPPPYTVKKHKLAKYVKLKANNIKGLEIITPWRFNLKDIPDILEKHKSWILKHLTQISSPLEQDFPQQINLAAIRASWEVKRIAHASKQLDLIATPHQIALVGNIKNEIACKAKLIAWIRNLAKQQFYLELTRLSKLTQLNYKIVKIKDQKTRWGSCTSEGVISLNYRLIFLAPELLQYVIIHELCHTKYLNHSPQFWALVSQFDVNWRQHRKALKHVKLPAWL